MALTPSTMLPLGSSLPAATLPDTVSGAERHLPDLLAGHRALVLMVICNHCPYVRLIGSEIGTLAADYAARGVAFVAVSANDAVRYPADAPARMAEAAADWGFGFPYLYDERQDLARALAAACTPECYVFDGAGRLVYRGAFDDARPGNDVVPTGAHVREALEALLHGRPGVPDDEQRPSIGCGIKWK